MATAAQEKGRNIAWFSYRFHFRSLAGEAAEAVSEKVDEAKEKAGELASAAQQTGRRPFFEKVF